MFGIGFPEMLLIMAIALIVVGPDKLPEMARSIAKGVAELKKTVESLKESFNEQAQLEDITPELKEVSDSIKKQIGDVTTETMQDVMTDTDSPQPETEVTEQPTTVADDLPYHQQEATEPDETAAVAEQQEPDVSAERSQPSPDMTAVHEDENIPPTQSDNGTEAESDVPDTPPENDTRTS